MKNSGNGGERAQGPVKRRGSGSVADHSNVYAFGPTANAGAGLKFDNLFRVHYEALVNFLRGRLGQHELELAEDIAQEAFCRVGRYLDTHDALENPRSLLFQIGKNLLIDYRRSGHVRFQEASLPIQDELLEDSNPNLERIAVGQQELERLWKIILQLPPRCQEVFVLSRFEGMEYHDIARRCGITVSMVEKHIKKAMHIVRGKMP